MDAALPLSQPGSTAPAQAASVVLVHDRREMAAIAGAWEELAANAVEPNPFYEPWMLLPAIEHLAGGDEVALATVWHAGKLGVLLPVCRTRLPRPFPGYVLAVWRHKHSKVGTPLVRAGQPGAESLRALLRWLAGGGDAASALQLDEVPSGGRFHAALVDALNAEGLAALTTGAYSRALLRRAADAESYIGSAVSRSTRRSLEKKEAALRAQGAIEYRVLRPGDDVGRWMEEFLALEAGGWKGGAGSAMACSEGNRRFAGAVMAEAHRRGRLLMSGIDLAGRPIARLWCFLAEPGSYGFKTAYDEAFKSFMPGFLAELHNIRELHARPALQWMDSYTSAGNSVMDRLWKDRLVVQNFLIGARGWGALCATALPLARWSKRAIRSSALAAAFYRYTRFIVSAG